MVLWFIGAAIAAAGAIKKGQSAKKKGEYDAKVLERDAAVARDQANAVSLRQQRAARKIMGSMRAAYGAAGVTVEGSPLDVLEESAGQAELDRLTIQYNAELKATGAIDGAALSIILGKEAEKAGYMEAGGTLMSSYGSKGMPSWFGGS